MSDYWDDDLDDLPANALDELEQAVYQTQRERQTESQTQRERQTESQTRESQEHLLRRIDQLLQENSSLRHDLTAKSGEISIVRSKHDRLLQSHDRELTALRRLHEDSLAAQKQELDESKNAERKAATELEFAKRDLFEAERARTRRVKTPKKTASHCDGFDDFSPRPSPGTPRKTPRKRRDSVVELEVVVADAEVPSVDNRFEVLQALLDHRTGSERTLEVLSRHQLSGETLSSLVLCRLAASPPDFVLLCQSLLAVWQQCFDAQKREPIPLLVGLVAFSLEHTSVGPQVIDGLLPLAQATADLVAIPRLQREPVVDDVDLTACMSLIHMAAVSCLPDAENIAHFWKLMRQDFVLILLSPPQAPCDFELMLRILSTSVLRESIGPILANPARQAELVGYFLDRITTQMSLSAVQTLHDFSQTHWGGEVVAKHPLAIGRLARLLADAMDSLYDFSSQSSPRIINLIVRLLRQLVTTYDLHMQRKLLAVGGVQKYLMCLARLSFSDDLVIESGIDPEVAECAHELLELMVTPEEGDAIHAAFT